MVSIRQTYYFTFTHTHTNKYISVFYLSFGKGVLVNIKSNQWQTLNYKYLTSKIKVMKKYAWITTS